MIASNPRDKYNVFSTNSLKVRNIAGLPVWLTLAVIAITTVTGVIAGLNLTRRAAKLDPVEPLHYE